MPLYEFTGRNHWVRRDGEMVRLAPGERVEMTEKAYEPLKDKFRPVPGEEAAAAAPAPDAGESQSEPEGAGGEPGPEPEEAGGEKRRARSGR